MPSKPPSPASNRQPEHQYSNQSPTVRESSTDTDHLQRPHPGKPSAPSAEEKPVK